MNYRCQANLQCLPVPMPVFMFMFFVVHLLFAIYFLRCDRKNEDYTTQTRTHTYSSEFQKKWKWMIYYFAHKLPKSQCLGFSAQEVTKSPAIMKPFNALTNMRMKWNWKRNIKVNKNQGELNFTSSTSWHSITIYCPLQMFIQFARKKTTTTTVKKSLSLMLLH